MGRRALIAIDTNILVYAHRIESPHFEIARRRISELAEGNAHWAIPWPCLHEFYAVVTGAKAPGRPTSPGAAIDQIAAWLESPSLRTLVETDRHWSVLNEVLALAPVSGIRIHDAKIAAICLQHGVRELWSADRDFSRFPQLKTVNPLVR